MDEFLAFIMITIVVSVIGGLLLGGGIALGCRIKYGADWSHCELP